ncbi:MAG: energy transducer TonB [Nitrospinae bacterium]|nr:energy transducer TonB [Nitrospinota bacterium]MDA1109148.1 energy transducer TonB [Nitrospinota bacterium]
MKPQVLNKPWQAVGTQARASKSLDSESVAHYQPSIPIAASNFSSPLQSTRLLKEAFIPPGFSEEKLNQDEEVSTRPIEKLARLSDGISDLSSALLNQIKNGFSAKIRNRIAQVKYYPRIARSRGFEGQPVVAFTLGNGGELLELSIVNPSPFKLLDEAALDAVKSASPYPPIPELLKINSMKFNLPISFMLEER